MKQNGSCSPMTSVTPYSLHYVVCVFLVKSSACRRNHHRAHCVVGALLVKSSACRRNHYLALTLLVPSSSKRRLADAIIILLISSSLHPLLVMLSALRCNHHPSHYVINALRTGPSKAPQNSNQRFAHARRRSGLPAVWQPRELLNARDCSRLSKRTPMAPMPDSSG